MFPPKTKEELRRFLAARKAEKSHKISSTELKKNSSKVLSIERKKKYIPMNQLVGSNQSYSTLGTIYII